jgi:hypothetical protein
MFVYLRVSLVRWGLIIAREHGQQAVSQGEHAVAPAAEQLDAVAEVEPGPLDHVAHECVAGDELAPGEGLGERVEVGGVAGTGGALGQLVLDHPAHAPARFAVRAVEFVGEPAPV